MTEPGSKHYCGWRMHVSNVWKKRIEWFYEPVRLNTSVSDHTDWLTGSDDPLYRDERHVDLLCKLMHCLVGVFIGERVDVGPYAREFNYRGKCMVWFLLTSFNIWACGQVSLCRATCAHVHCIGQWVCLEMLATIKTVNFAMHKNYNYILHKVKEHTCKPLSKPLNCTQSEHLLLILKRYIIPSNSIWQDLAPWRFSWLSLSRLRHQQMDSRIQCQKRGQIH